MQKSRKKQRTFLYLAVTADEYELPMVVEDTTKRLAEKCGVTMATLYRHFNGEIQGVRPNMRYKYVKVEVDE